jgi:outer membrane lipoprotein-sorting protein
MPATTQSQVDPWSQMQALKDRLAGERVSADFVQTFLPAGFSSGDEEAGVMHLSIPDCLRWDYLQPYQKSYLVCGQEAYSWNAGESQGRRFLLESDSEPGLDFLRLRIEALESRYSVMPETLNENVLKIVFTPLDPGHSLVQATVILDMQTHLLSRLLYEDMEGNQTRFDVSNYRPISGPDPFELPPDIEWLEQ